MSLISKEVEILLVGTNVKYYENLGYLIPRSEDKRKRLRIPKGTKIKIKTEDLPNGSNVEVEIKCDNCEKIYKTLYQNYAKYNHEGKNYCKLCHNKVLNSGYNNSRYNFNKTQEERENERGYPEYIEFIKKVLKRDNYTCQCCNKKSKGDMEVHHLDGYNWCKEKRTEETNGITLCKTCHDNFHSIYGKGNNTKE